ncbi:Peroxidase 71-like protein [Drosera capensis]
MAMAPTRKMIIAAVHLILWAVVIPSSTAQALAPAPAETPTNFSSELKVGFYQKTCPRAEEIVANVIRKYSKIDDGTIPGIIRLIFHDCFITGCDASVLVKNINGMQTEMANLNQLNTLRGLDAIEAAKLELEKECPGTVSCADVLAFAARDSIVLLGNPSYAVPAGRRDSLTSKMEDAAALPGPNMNAANQVQAMADRGFNVSEVVVLLGSHGVGRAHCFNSIADPKFVFVSPVQSVVIPLLDKGYERSVLYKHCRGIVSLNDTGRLMLESIVPLDPTNAATRKKHIVGAWGAQYYKNIMNGKEPLASDLAFAVNGATREFVYRYAVNPKKWAEHFNAAMIKLSTLNPLTGNQGNIRKVCGVLNN